MTKAAAVLTEILDTGAGTGLRFFLGKEINFRAGQYFHASRENCGDVLPQPFFPLRAGVNFIDLLPLRPGVWQAGEEIALRGPLGNSFHLPPSAVRIGLVASPEASPAVLFPLINQTLEEGKEVVLASNRPPVELPAAVEVLPLDQADEAADWADALAVCTVRQEVPEMKQLFSQMNGHKPVELCILSEMPCGGLAACGICMIETRQGWKHICKDGPVFSLYELVVE